MMPWAPAWLAYAVLLAAPAVTPPCERAPLPALVRGITMVHMDDLSDGDPRNDGARGYGTPVSARMTQSIRQAGLNLVSLTTVLRLRNARDTALRNDLDAPGRANVEALLRQMAQARDAGLAVMVVPHVQLDDGAWRGDIHHAPGSDGAKAFFAALQRETVRVARVAQQGCANVLSMGLEFKALSAQHAHRPDFVALVAAVRAVFDGVITYSANWDEAAAVTFWDVVDMVGVNAFHPLDGPGHDLEAGARAVGKQLEALRVATGKKVLLTEFGYKATSDGAVRPWEWPSRGANGPPADEALQARAYRALLCAVLPRPWSAGAVAWFTPSDGNDAQHPNRWEGRNGFNPFGKPALGVLAAGCGP